MLISKTPKAVWKNLYRAYRTHQNNQFDYAIHGKWLDALDLLYATLEVRSLGSRIRTLCFIRYHRLHKKQEAIRNSFTIDECEQLIIS